MKEKCSLDKLPLGVTGIVYRVNCNENIKNRIFDFGIMENSPVIPLFTIPLGSSKPAHSFKKFTLAGTFIVSTIE